MAIFSPATTTMTTRSYLRLQKLSPSSLPSLPLPSFYFSLRPSFAPLTTNRCTRVRTCQAALSPPPPGKDPVPPKVGIGASLARLKDRVRIFVAVLIWLCLFFWVCAWDMNNDGSGGPNRRFPFK